MELKVNGCRIRLEYSFILVLAFCALFNADEILDVLLHSSLHELAHLAVLFAVGGKADSLTLSYYGVALRYSSRLTNVRELMVISAGPLLNLLLYLLFKNDINLSLFIINALPVYPLDGGRVLNLLSYKLSVAVSRVMIIILLIFSLYVLIKFHSFSLLLITMYLIIYIINY